MTDTWLKIGIVGKAHGLYGAFFISGRKDQIEGQLSTIKLGANPQSAETYTVQFIKNHNGRAIVKLKELSGRDKLDPLKGQAVWCLREQLEIDEAQEFFWDDLIGKKVVDKQGELLGHIKSIENYGASDVVEIGSDRGSLLVPLVSDYFDTSFAKEDESVHLKVGADVFDEAWQS